MLQVEGLAAVGNLGVTKSPDVERLQKELKRAGFDPGPIDGLVGAKTAAATVRLALAISQKLAQFPSLPSAARDVLAKVTEVDRWLRSNTSGIPAVGPFGLADIVASAGTIKTTLATAATTARLIKQTSLADRIESVRSVVDKYVGQVYDFVQGRAGLLADAAKMYADIFGAPAAPPTAALPAEPKITAVTVAPAAAALAPAAAAAAAAAPAAARKVFQAFDKATGMFIVATLQGARMYGLGYALAQAPTVTASPTPTPGAETLTLEQLAAKLSMTPEQIRKLAGIKLPWYRTTAGIVGIALGAVVIVGGSGYLIMRRRRAKKAA